MIRAAIPIAWRIGVLLLVSVGIAASVNAVSPRGIPWPPETPPPEGPPSEVAPEGMDTAVGYVVRANQAMKKRAAKYGIETVDLATTRRLVHNKDIVILDARTAERFAAGHLPGAISMPVGDAAHRFESLQLLLPPDQPVLVYCSGGQCDDSLMLGRFLHQQGMNAWHAAGLKEDQGM